MEISSAVANVVMLFKNHLPDLNMEILCKDFTIDDTERKALAHSAYDAAHEFVPLYDFPALLSPMTTTVPWLCNTFLCAALTNC
jgi:hypothetical protein